MFSVTFGEAPLVPFFERHGLQHQPRLPIRRGQVGNGGNLGGLPLTDRGHVPFLDALYDRVLLLDREGLNPLGISGWIISVTLRRTETRSDARRKAAGIWNSAPSAVR